MKRRLTRIFLSITFTALNVGPIASQSAHDGDKKGGIDHERAEPQPLLAGKEVIFKPGYSPFRVYKTAPNQGYIMLNTTQVAPFTLGHVTQKHEVAIARLVGTPYVINVDEAVLTGGVKKAIAHWVRDPKAGGKTFLGRRFRKKKKNTEKIHKTYGKTHRPSKTDGENHEEQSGSGKKANKESEEKL